MRLRRKATPAPKFGALTFIVGDVRVHAMLVDGGIVEVVAVNEDVTKRVVLRISDLDTGAERVHALDAPRYVVDQIPIWKTISNGTISLTDAPPWKQQPATVTA